ncbi:MAG: hypothetical protein IKN04_19120 [Clostridia bacterium]|nr:hypothetical protein [Clostridia bacterium]
MKRLLALLLTLLLALTSGFALAENPPVENEDIASILSSLLDSIQEKAEEAISDKIGEVTGTLSDKIGEAAENIPDKANKLIENLPDQVQEIIGDLPDQARELIEKLPDETDELLKLLQEKLGVGEEYAAGLISSVKEALPGIWENTKTAVTEKADDAKEFIKEKGRQLWDWITKGEPEDEPVEESDDVPDDRVYYFDLLYFGMPIREAKELGLGDLSVDEENAVQFLVVLCDEPQGFAVVLFSGLDDSAKLTEIVCMLYSDADTVTDLEEGIDIQTTEETVNAVYDEIESWFTDLQAVELGDHLALPLYLSLSDEEETISRAVLYLYEDGEGYNAATHYVSTTDCGVNILQYLYLDTAEAEALLAE